MITTGVIALAMVAVGAGLAHAFTNPARSEMEQMRKNRDWWREYAIQLAGQCMEAGRQIQCQRQNVAFAHEKAEELREALRNMLGEGCSGECTEPSHVAARKLIGEEAQS